jgi:hypothetical protein
MSVLGEAGMLVDTSATTMGVVTDAVVNITATAFRLCDADFFFLNFGLAFAFTSGRFFALFLTAFLLTVFAGFFTGLLASFFADFFRETDSAFRAGLPAGFFFFAMDESLIRPAVGWRQDEHTVSAFRRTVKPTQPYPIAQPPTAPAFIALIHPATKIRL